MSSTYQMLIWTLVFTFALTFHPRMTRDVAAQTQDDCELCEDRAGEHRFDLDTGLCEPEDPECKACDGSEDMPDGDWFCHTDWVPDICLNAHNPCGLQFAAADQQRLLEAIGTRNVSDAVEVLVEYQGVVTLNRRRSALQWKNCQGALTGHLPLGTGVRTFLDQVAEDLRSMDLDWVSSP